MLQTFPKEALAIFGGEAALPEPPRTHMPLTDAFAGELRSLIEERPLSSLFGEGEVAAFETAFAAHCGRRYAVALNSGTSSLHTALTAAGIGPGDDVAVTCFSFVASASVIVQAGARPVFVDIDPDTLSMDIGDLKRRLTSRTRAVITAHLFGIPGDIVALSDFCRKEGLLLIEDACQALGASVNGRKVGSFGDLGCFSFNVKKIIQTGEGGMLTTDNAELAEAAREIRVNGLSIFGVERLGFNYTLTNLQALLGLYQLNRLEDILARRNAYAEKLGGAIRDYAKVFEERRSDVTAAPYAVAFEIPEAIGSRRDMVVAALAREGVPISGVYSVLYDHDQVFAEDGAAPCAVAEGLVPRLLSVNPSHLYTAEDIDAVCLGLRKVLSNLDSLPTWSD